ncbi:MAG TPA: lysophospholipase [Myxococcota bacterium]|nr:lysophospholipase [Myxococcota bacterium]HRY92363.1 lysophospholipase [Myxococcota bacterium]HSA22942.1 lysophospholipase [Myxococcota bacterium]
MDAKGGAEHKEHFFHAEDGLRLFFRSWSVPEPRGLVALLHGYAEHCGRYDHVAARLNEAGWSVAAVDYRGHGQSGGKRAHIEAFEEYLGDLDAFLGEARRAGFEGKPVLLGHSQGGLIAARYAELHPEGLRALALSSPFMDLAMQIPAVKAMAGRVMSRVWPSFSMPSGLDPSWVSHDQAAVARYAADPLVSHNTTARWFTEVTRAQAETLAEAGRLALPLLVQQAGDDRLALVEATRRLFGGAGSQDKRLEVYEGYYHEIFNEVGKDRVFADLTGWLDRLA